MSGKRRSRGKFVKRKLQVEPLEGRQLLSNVYTVTNTLDDGSTGSLRWAITQVDADISDTIANPDRITFNIPQSDSGYAGAIWTIAPASALPTVTKPVVIDGYSQPGASPNTNGPGLAENARLAIVLSGAAAPAGTNGLQLSAAAITVRGLSINGFGQNSADSTGGAGIAIDSPGGDVVAGNFIGTNAAGLASAANGGAGVSIADSADNTIGGTTPDARNLMAGNGGAGILVTGNAATGNLVEGNFIGFDATATTAILNHDGVAIHSAPGNTVGGTTPSARNIISGNWFTGVKVDGTGAANNLIEGNFVGTDPSGTAGLGRFGIGIDINVGARDTTIGGTVSGSGNVISGNAGGINVFSPSTSPTTDAPTGTVIEGNLVGTDATGLKALANNVGIFILSANSTVGGTTAAARNIISGNNGDGVTLTFASATGNVIEGNLIGLDITGTAPLPNRGDGGVVVDGAVGNTIGGTTAGTGNVIAANVHDGIAIFNSNAVGVASHNAIAGNLIGLDVTGETALPNGQAGVYLSPTNSGDSGFAAVTANTIGGTTATARNVIADGIILNGESVTDTVIQGNYVGTDITGSRGLGTGGAGITVQARSSGNTIGGTTAGARNLVSGNAGDGILVMGIDSSTNTIEGNWVGTDVSGTQAVPNRGAAGIHITAGTKGNIIGGTTAGAGNVVAGNTGDGVLIQSSSGNMVAGNLIGFTADGSTGLSNGASGLMLAAQASNNTIGGTVIAARNVIAHNNPQNQTGDAELLITDGSTIGNLVEGNFIGTDVTGMAAAENRAEPDIVRIASNARANTIGGTTAAARNVIAAGNAPGTLASSGVDITGQATFGNVVAGNFIGTDATGLHQLDSGAGVVLQAGAVANTVGGTAEGAGNVISGVRVVSLASTGFDATLYNVVEGNLIGTDATGTVVLPRAEGVVVAGALNTTVGGTAAGTGNTIAVRPQAAGPLDPPAVELTAGAASNRIEGNFIGIDASATVALNDPGPGILIHGGAAHNTIGGAFPGAGNVIADNAGAGVQVGDNTSDSATVDNAILSNSLFGNGGLGIDLGGSGIPVANSPGGPHPGPNDLQNHPVLTSAVASSDSTDISGTLNSTPNEAFTIQFFANRTADAALDGQAKTFLGQLSGVATGDDGNAPAFTFTFAGNLAGQYISATATDPDGNTSELSPDIAAAQATPTADLSVTGLGDPTATAGERISWTYQVTNNGPGQATNVQVTGTVPDRLVDAAGTASAGNITISGGEFHDMVSSLGAGQSFTVTITATTTTAGGFAAPVEVSADQTDPTPGDDHFATVVNVAPAPVVATSIVLSASSTAPIAGQPITFTAAVTPSSGTGTPTGSVTFFVDGKPQPIAPLQPVAGRAEAVFVTPGLTQGRHAITATYSGSTAFAGSHTTEALTLDVAAPAGPAPTVLSVQGQGFRARFTSLVLTFSEPLSTASAQNRSNYHVSGPGRSFVPITSAVYDPAADTVTLQLARPLGAFGHHRLTVNGSTPGGVADIDGTLLDGAHTGHPGTDYVTTITLRNRVPAGPAWGGRRMQHRLAAGVRHRAAR